MKLQKGVLINIKNRNQFQAKAVIDSLSNAGAIPILSIYEPSEEHGTWLCWSESDEVELGTLQEHLECLSDYDIESNDMTHLFFPDHKEPASLRSQYADRINYYKRMIQTGSFGLDKLTINEAYQKLGYWEGRYDELTVGGKA